MDKPHDADEQAFWDAAYVSLCGGAMANPSPDVPQWYYIAGHADKMLEERRKRFASNEAPNASP